MKLISQRTVPGKKFFMFSFFDQNPTALFVFLPLIVWTMVWKGLALWKAAKLNQRNWFIIMLVLNTAGILEVLYIFVFSKPRGWKFN